MVVTSIDAGSKREHAKRDSIEFMKGVVRDGFLVFITTWLGMVATVTAQVDSVFTRLVAANSAAIVNIGTTQKRPRRPPGLPEGLTLEDIPRNSPFYEFFRRFFDGEGDGEGPVSRSLGSGFIISRDGYIITNHHVVADADEIVVRLSDRRELTAELVGADKPSDIALLRIDACDLLVVKVARGDEVKVGEWVIAFGSSFGFERSVSAGIVSARGRSLPRANYISFIQTDVAINPGNSGGPLFNLDGEVVGINSAIFSGTGSYMGLSFAIPIGLAMNVVEQLKANGRVARGWLGVMIQEVTNNLAQSFGMTPPRGALISKVLRGGPAKRAGLKAGDVVLAFAGRPIRRASELPPLVGLAPIGSSVPVELLMSGETRTVAVEIAALPDTEEQSLSSAGAQSRTEDSGLGLSVTDLTPEQRARYGVGKLGVLVVEVRDGPAKRAGIRPGDVVLMLDNTEIRTSADFERHAAKLDRGPVSMLLQRDGNPLFLAFENYGTEG